MIQEWKPDLLTKLYVFSFCLLAYAGASVSWLYVIPKIPLNIAVVTFAILKILVNGISVNFKKFIWILFWFLFNFGVIMTQNRNMNAVFYRLLSFFIISSVILLSIEEMKYLLKALTVCFVIILVVSVPAWILYRIGVPLPHTGPHYHSDGYHIYFDYYFFRTNARITSSNYERFQSIFLEPGQLATPLVLLFHLNTKDGKLFQFKNIVLLVGVLLSLSLIGYGLLIVSLVVNQIQSIRSRGPLIILMIFVLVGLSIYFVNHEDNAVHELIVSRLEYDEEEGNISGYNRTTEDFDIRYEQMMQTSDKYFGIQEGDNLEWITNTSGYKKFIVLYGLVGFVLLMSLMLILLWDNFNATALVFITMVVVAFFVRNLLTSTLWMSITIIGMYILGRTQSTKNLGYSNMPNMNRQQTIPI